MKEYRKKYGNLFYGAAVLCALSAAAAVLVQFLKGMVLDTALEGAGKTAAMYGLLLFGCILFECLTFYWYNALRIRFSSGCLAALKQDVFAAILGKSVPAFRKEEKGSYLSRLTNRCEGIGNQYFGTLLLLAEVLVKILLVSAALFWLDVRLAVLTLFLLTTPLYVPKLIEKALQQAQTDAIEASERWLGRTEEWLTVFEMLKNFSAEAKILNHFQTENEELLRKQRRQKDWMNRSRLLSMLISYLSHFLVLIFAAALVVKGSFSAGDFFTAVGMIDQLSYPLIILSELIGDLVSIRPVCREMEAFLQERSDASENLECGPLISEICLDQISFRYDSGHTGKMLLKDFSLHLEPKKKYLLQGASGSGKTTVTDLILGYLKPQKGVIRINGSVQEEMQNRNGSVTVVRQDAMLLQETLRNNLTMYAEISDAEILDVLKKVGLGAYASKAGLEMQVEYGGTNLSGGERKRICLARALLRKTPILILDEPLANLDAETADAVEDALLAIEDRTVLLVSHQFTPWKRAAFDEILELKI